MFNPSSRVSSKLSHAHGRDSLETAGIPSQKSAPSATATSVSDPMVSDPMVGASRISNVDGRGSPESFGMPSGTKVSSKTTSSRMPLKTAISGSVPIPREARTSGVPCFTVTREPDPNERTRWVDWVVSFARTRIWAKGEDAVHDWAEATWHKDASMVTNTAESSSEQQAVQLEGLRTEVRCSFEGYKDLLKNESEQIFEYSAQSTGEQNNHLLQVEQRLRELEERLYGRAVEQRLRELKSTPDLPKRKSDPLRVPPDGKWSMYQMEPIRGINRP